jgi:hypothetical protein
MAFTAKEGPRAMTPRDRTTEALIDALAQAVVGGEYRLYRAGKLDGLFPGRTAACVEGAGRAMAEGLLERVRVETKGKTEIEWVRLTPRGVQFLHDHESPVRALHELRTALHVGQKVMPVWLDEMRGVLGEVGARLEADAQRWSARLDVLERRVDDALRRLEAAGPLVPPELSRDHPWAVDALNYLDRRRTAGAPELCPLPELFTAVVEHHPQLLLSAFQEGLRLMHRRKAILLRPANSHEDMAGPEFALLDGAVVYYYAVR